ncbi:MAG: hypothetical protein WCR42_11785 [bacterium]
MLKKINRISGNVALIVLSAITFLFLHSELGLFACAHQSHDAHDFCHIVQNTTDDDENHQSHELSKIIVDQSIFPIIEFESQEIVENYILLYADESTIPIYTYNVYIRNESFLI